MNLGPIMLTYLTRPEKSFPGCFSQGLSWHPPKVISQAFVVDVLELMNREQMPEAATKCAESDEGAEPRIFPRAAMNSNNS